MEHKYETDMSKKEKRQREWDKLESLSFWGKIEYIWMYYKAWFLILAAAAVIVYLGVSMYQGSKENVLLNIAIVGGNSQDTESIQSLEQEVKEWLGASGKHDTVRVQANIPGDGGSISSQTALTTLIGANAVDVLICPEDVYNEYAGQGGFRENTLILQNKEITKEKLGVDYDKVYISVMINAEHLDNAELVMKHLSEISE